MTEHPAYEHINEIKTKNLSFRRICRDRRNDVEYPEVKQVTIQGKQVKYRADHNEVKAGLTYPKIAVLAMMDLDEVAQLKAYILR